MATRKAVGRGKSCIKEGFGAGTMEADFQRPHQQASSGSSYSDQDCAARMADKPQQHAGCERSQGHDEWRPDDGQEPHDRGQVGGGVRVHKQPHSVVEMPRITFPHLVGEETEQDQEERGTGQPGDKGRAQSREQGWSAYVRSSHAV